MHFDDRLATVLRQTATGEAIARIQYRQLLDLLGSASLASSGGPGHDAAYLRLAELNATIPPATRAAILRESGLRLRNAHLVAQLAGDDSAVAAAAFDNASLGEDEWLDLIPALPLAARGFLARGASRGARVDALLDRLGIRERTLPGPDMPPSAVDGDAALAAPVAVARLASEREEQQPDRLAARAPANDIADSPGTGPETGRTETGEAIRAIVRRIEEFRRARVAVSEQHGDDSPRLPLGELFDEPQRRIEAFDFTTDGQARIIWADSEAAPMVVGFDLGDPDGAIDAPGLRHLTRRHQPLRGSRIAMAGPPAIAGHWRLDAMPVFDAEGGRFTGFSGRMRRIAESGEAAAPLRAGDAGGDAMRQALHELRNPVAAIQGFAEMTQQGLQGPISHEYRALAATIASDSARILAAFDEIERLVKLDSGALDIEAGSADLAALVRQVVAHLEPFTQRRASGFQLSGADAGLPVAIGPADAERLVWRLLAALSGMTAPGETLRLKLRENDGGARLTVRLPAALAALPEDGIYRAGAAQAQALSAGMLGTGFALRLARSEARAAGGNLVRKDDRLKLTLPGLTAGTVGHSQQGAAAG